MTKHVWQVIGTFSHIDEPVEWYVGDDFQEACTRLGQLLMSKNIQSVRVSGPGGVKRIVIEHEQEDITDWLASYEIIPGRNSHMLLAFHRLCIESKQTVLIVVPRGVDTHQFMQPLLHAILKENDTEIRACHLKAYIDYPNGSRLFFAQSGSGWLRGMRFDHIYALYGSLQSKQDVVFLRSLSATNGLLAEGG